MLERILQIILPVFAIAAAGFVYGRTARPDTAGANRMNMDVFVPVLVLSALTAKEFDLWASRWLVAGGVAVILGSGLVAWPVARWLGVAPRTFVPSMMFNNSGNMGLPLALLAFGEVNLPLAVALFVTSNLLHFTLGTYIIRHDAHFGHLLRSPIVIATALGVALSVAGIRPPGWVAVALRMLGDVSLPLMLFTLGVRMVDTPLGNWRIALVGAALRPALGLAVALPLGPHLGLDRTSLGMLYLFASLPPAVLNFLLAEQYRQEPDKVASIVLIGNLGSLVFVPIGLALALR